MDGVIERSNAPLTESLGSPSNPICSFVGEGIGATSGSCSNGIGIGICARSVIILMPSPCNALAAPSVSM